MRLGRLTLWDIKLQVKYGFYLLYGILSALYLAALYAMPEDWREKAANIFIFSDPAAMGLFFMGAIVLLEKNQRVPCAFAVSPVRAMEYIAAKVASLGVIGLAVAAVLAIGVKTGHLVLTLLGTAMSGIIFTLLGIILATKITSLNQFILWTVPVEAMGFAPAILHLFGAAPAALPFYPTSVCMDMIAGKQVTAAGVVIVLTFMAGLLAVAHRCVIKMWKYAGGGGKL